MGNFRVFRTPCASLRMCIQSAASVATVRVHWPPLLLLKAAWWRPVQ